MTDGIRTHYVVLGVPRDASDADIKRAWARQVREHPPEKDAEGNQRINEAKQVLLDPKARTRYDAHLNHGSEIDGLVLEALIAAEAEDHAAAAAALKKAVALAPDDDSMRNLWALETKRAGNPTGAVSIMRGLVKRAPDVALYHYNLGTLLWELEDPDEEIRMLESLTLLSRAVDLEPHNSDYHVGLARCYTRLELFDKAEQAIEAAVMTDGEVNVQDVEALFELPIIHVLAGRLDRIGQDADRIRAVVAGLDEDAHKYCGYRFARLAVELVQAKAFEPAHYCAKAAVRCSPNDPDLNDLVANVGTLCSIEDELTSLGKDSQIPAPIRVLMAMRGLVQIDEMKADDAQETYDAAIDALASLPPLTIVQAMDRARRSYPTLYELGADSFRELRRIAQNLTTASQPATAPSTSGSGCVLVLGTLLSLAGAIVAMFVR